MLREQIDWPTVWSLRPSSMDGGGGGGRSRISTSQLTEHRRYVYIMLCVGQFTTVCHVCMGKCMYYCITREKFYEVIYSKFS